MSSLRNKVALITGASAGIGAGIAVHFASLGCRLAITGRSEAALASVRDRCVARGQSSDNVLIVVGDLKNDDDTRRIVTETMAYFHQLDVLVNSAGTLIFGSIETQTMETFDRTMDLNLRSVVHITQLAVPHLIKARGNIIIISGTTGQRGLPRILALSMAKAALNMFTEVIALDLASKGVRVNSINPGVIRTELHLRGGMSPDDYEKVMTKYLEHSTVETHPLGAALGRIGTVEDVAKAAAFVASDQAEFVTGIHLTVDGGRVLALPK